MVSESVNIMISKHIKDSGNLNAYRTRLAIFTYEFPLAVENFRKAGVTLRTLSNYSSMLEAALATNYIKAEDIETLKEWRKDPANWVPANPNAE